MFARNIALMIEFDSIVGEAERRAWLEAHPEFLDWACDEVVKVTRAFGDALQVMATMANALRKNMDKFTEILRRIKLPEEVGT